MHLGLYLAATGHHAAGWRMPGAQAGGQNLPLITRIAQTAERGKFDMVFFADSPNSAPNMHPGMIVRLEPLTLLAALATATQRIGLAATVSTTYTEPYNLARMMSSLDHISNGRVAWNVVTGSFSEVGENFSKAHPPHDKRYAIAAEYLDVVKGLWDGWEDGALVMDRDTGVYVDLSKRHELNHKGEFYSVRGPLNITRSPQGHPVIIQAGASDAGKDFAAASAEVIYSIQQELESSLAFNNDIRERARATGRDPSRIKILPGVIPLVGSTEKEAREKLARLGELVDPKTALQVLAERLGHNLDRYPLDALVPDLPPSDGMRGHAESLKKLAKKHNFTLRELRDYTSVGYGHRLLIGTPEQVADGLLEWFDAGAADGFNIMPPWFPESFDDFVDHVVPLLQSKGKFRRDYAGATLREHLGLSVPPNCYQQ
jgi:FMN-dependent oxidoreductase (nitrilotriacetate monooxygenase family)